MRIYKYLLAAAMILLSMTVSAEIKMGVVNVTKIMEESPQADEAKKQLQQEFKPREKELLDAKNKLVELERELKKNADIMSESERRKKERDLIQGQRDFKRTQDEWREDLALRRNEESGKLLRKIFEAIESLAKAENYDVIFGEGVMYAKDSVDITEKVLRKLNQVDKAAGKTK